MLKSPVIADEVVSTLHLDQDPEFALGDKYKGAPAAARDALIDKVVEISRSGGLAKPCCSM
uniref:Uncharacterized protein n=1 Tax=Phenylobacterium glaciei TaxID=2803784 RepID=A0A974P739_9CAUL|nr:hypothetical protein JKL49_11670 [Phenylobacterium glaciei]